MKLYLEPFFDKPDRAEGGIRRIVEAQRRLLPQFGVECVSDINQADITAGHGGARPLKAGIPFVSQSHGLYWSDYCWEGGEDSANRRVIDCLTCADAITVPSDYVRTAFVRGLLRYPIIIPHGVDPDEWHSEQNGGYVLWNKPRHDAVSNVNDLVSLVKAMPGTSFVSTLGVRLPNLKVVGKLPHSEMKSVIQRAGVYLALPRETFGIGTLEALAAGVPVAGWDYGGQRDIIIPGETGYLAPWGDYKALAECVNRCFVERTRLSPNCRADVLARWQWPDKIERYAQVYRDVLAERARTPGVSVVVTCHNLAKFLPDALGSVLSQTFQDWECIVVDDASTDETAGVSAEWCAKDNRFRYLRSDENLKLSRARCFGFANANGRYFINLDADDKLTPNALALLVTALERHPNLHIAYGSLDVLSEDGTKTQQNPFPREFHWLEQMAHLNQLHYAALMRREVWENTGGNRERLWRAEDAEFWCRATSYGYRAAKVTEETTLLWRNRADGKSHQEREKYKDIDGDWTADFPWAISHNAQDGLKRKGEMSFGIPNWTTLPFGAPVDKCPIWHRQKPLISIIIPLGPGHNRYVIDALDSCIAQTWGDWEVLVVNDTGEPLERIDGAPYARIVSTGGQKGAGAARNVGLAQAKGAMVFFLDADDQMHPTCLAKMLERYRQGDAGYVYSGWTVIRPDAQTMEFTADEYDPQAWLLGKSHGRNIVSVLMATEDAKRIGFNGELVAYEDWDFFIRCAIDGVWGKPVKELLVTYRAIHGQRSVGSGKPHHVELVHFLRDTYGEYIRGEKPMSPCPGGCGGNKRAIEQIEAARAAMRGRVGPLLPTITQTSPVKDGFTRMKFTGDRRGPVTYYVEGVPYTGANSDEWRFVDAANAHVPRLEAMGVWQRVKVPPPAPPVPTDSVRVQPIDMPVEKITSASLPVIEKPVEPVPLPAAPVAISAGTSLAPPPSEQPPPVAALTEAAAVVEVKEAPIPQPSKRRRGRPRKP